VISLSVIVPSYAYTLIKIENLKLLIMDEKALRQLDGVRDVKSLIELLEPYYPGLRLHEYTIEEIEKALFNFFITLIGKIITVTPDLMRNFLKNFLLKYEIINLKYTIIGTILGFSKEEKSKNVNLLVEEYLDNKEFMQDLIAIQSLAEVQLFMKKTKYNKVVEEGIRYFNNYNEIFVLEAYLDKFYYESMINLGKLRLSKERLFISKYIDYITELYNINIIYRGIANKIEKNLLSQLIIFRNFVLKHRDFNILLKQNDLDNFFMVLNKIFTENPKTRRYFHPKGETEKEIMNFMQEMYMELFFKQIRTNLGDIAFFTIYRILELIIKKEKEIQKEILPRIVRVFRKKIFSR